MISIVVLSEEESGKIIAEHVAQKLGFADVTLCLAHEGKSDLENSFPRKIASWRGPNPPRFVIMRDNDGADCLIRKKALMKLIPSHAIDRVKVRLVIQELESWYFGDLDAVAKSNLIGSQELLVYRQNRRFRVPDAIRNPKQEFKKKIVEAGQTELARSIGPHLRINENLSRSFQIFVEALRWAGSPA